VDVFGLVVVVFVVVVVVVAACDDVVVVDFWEMLSWKSYIYINVFHEPLHPYTPPCR